MQQARSSEVAEPNADAPLPEPPPVHSLSSHSFNRMRLSASIASLVFASTFVFAGPPNPDKLYALQSAAAAADAAAAAANAPSAHDWIDQLQPQPRSRHRRHVGRAGHAGGFGSPHEKALRRLELEQRGLAAGLERERERRLAQNASLLPEVGVEVVEPKSAVKRLSARGGGGVWTGVSSYYLFALYDSDRHAVLDAIKSGGFSAVRIFIASVGPNNKGSSSQAVSDCTLPISPSIPAALSL